MMNFKENQHGFSSNCKAIPYYVIYNIQIIKKIMKRLNSLKIVQEQNKIIHMKTQETNMQHQKYYEIQQSGNVKRFSRKNNSSFERKINRSSCYSNQILPLTENTQGCTTVTPKTSNGIPPFYLKLQELLKTPSYSTQKNPNLSVQLREKYLSPRQNCSIEMYLDPNKEEKIYEEKQFSCSRHSNSPQYNSKDQIFRSKNNMHILKKEVSKENYQKLQVKIFDLKSKKKTVEDEFFKYRKEKEDKERKLQKKLDSINLQLDEKNKKMDQLKKKNRETFEQLKICKADRQYLRKENILLKRKMPQNALDHQSWRELSLEGQLKDLKNQILKNKTSTQQQLQQIIDRLRQQNQSLVQNIGNLRISQRMMVKKSEEAQKYMQTYKEMKAQFSNMEKNLKKVEEECQYLRKQNVRLKKKQNSIKSYPIPYKGKKQKPLKPNSSAESLTLSLKSKQ